MCINSVAYRTAIWGSGVGVDEMVAEIIRSDKTTVCGIEECI